jgi:opacity protein-like surface antigen
MVYGLAGANFSKVRSTYNDWTFDNGSGGGDSIYDPEEDTIDSGSEYVMGWRVGGGAEFSVSDQMSLFAQGTYTWLNTELETPNLNSVEDPEDASSLDTKLGIVAINVGLNFQF